MVYFGDKEVSKSGFTIRTALTLLFTFAAKSSGEYSGGSGTEAEPFRISAVSDWQELMTTPPDWASHFVLTSDIDLNDVAITPIGNDPNNFTGVFDGNDFVIRNADVNMPGSDYVGLFGYLGTGGQVKDLGVEDISISGGACVASLLGCNEGTVSDCYCRGSISGTGNCVGELVAYNFMGTIINCHSTGSVSATSIVGGLVGWNEYGIMSNCYSTGSVNAVSYAGGLAGENHQGTIINCYSTGSVTGDRYVGGLVGENAGTTRNCYSTGSVSGNYRVGGLVGSNGTWGTVSDCYSTGLVSSTGSYLGGLVGRSSSGAISSSFWDVNTSGWTTSAGGTGKTTAEMQDINTFLEAGWDFVAETANGTCNFWLMPHSGGYPVLSTLNGYIPAEPPGSGTEADPYVIRDANELGTIWYRPSACYVMANDIDLAGISWSGAIVSFFDGVFDGNEHTVCNVDANIPGADYIGLFGYCGTNGQIKNLGVEDTSIFGRNYVGSPVAVNYGTISNCYSTGLLTGTGSYVGGLVGRNYGGAIANCHATAFVTGTGDYVGGLVGYNADGAISNCYSTGSVSGDWCVGGLMGRNYEGSISTCYSSSSVSGSSSAAGLVGENSSGTISNCYSSGPVSGVGTVGGLVAENRYGTVSNCYSTGSVSGTWDYVGGLVGLNYYGTISNCNATGLVNGTRDYVGGLVGWNYEGAISNSYSTGSVNGDDYVGGLVGYDEEAGVVTASFWDVNTSGQSTSASGTPKTTAEMKTESTFTSAGWDFIGETANGSEDIWAICEGTNYPRLVWQIPAADWICPDGVGLEDFSYLGGVWGSADPDPANLDGEDGIGFGDLMIFCELWLTGR